jgi:hypothetical protein
VRQQSLEYYTIFTRKNANQIDYIVHHSSEEGSLAIPQVLRNCGLFSVSKRVRHATITYTYQQHRLTLYIHREASQQSQQSASSQMGGTGVESSKDCSAKSVN